VLEVLIEPRVRIPRDDVNAAKRGRNHTGRHIGHVRVRPAAEHDLAAVHPARETASEPSSRPVGSGTVMNEAGVRK